jgi:DNA-directed RNA polymerase subunit RPC12/RpoP
MAMVLTRQVKCPQCGAPKEALDDSVLVICDYCGSFVSLETGQYFRGDGLARLQQKSIDRLINPSAADARKLKVQHRMSEAQKADDRAAYRAAAQEYTALLAVTDPESVGGKISDPQERKAWAAKTAKAQELMVFDPAVKAVYAQYTEILQKLYKSEEPVADARRMMEVARNYYATLNAHPDYPFAESGSTDSLVRSMVRSAIASMESFLGKGVARRIYTEVLGDKESTDGTFSCENCGAPLTAAEMEGACCPYCGGVIRVEQEDPWLSNLLATWRASAAMLPNDEALASGAINHPLASYWVNGQVPTAADAYAFLRRAVGWLPQALLQKQLRTLKMAYSEEPPLSALLEALEAKLAHWTPSDKPQPSAQPAAPGGPRGVEDAAGTTAAGGEDAAGTAAAGGEDAAGTAAAGADPWVEQTVSMWQHVKTSISADNLEMSLLSQALGPFYLGGQIRAAQAKMFFEKAEPGYSSRKMKKAISLMKSAAGSNPAMADFLKRLAKLL